MRKVILQGNEAVALGAWEAGAGLGIGYPGTPSTEILESLATRPGPAVAWAVNEKVALEEGFGACVGGQRTLVTMKHVGLNVAADPLFTIAYMGVNAGLVVAVADDPGLHSSQNEQDNRWYALHAKTPMVEPSDSEECRLFTRIAFELGEKHDLVFLLRLVTRVCHGRGLVNEDPDRPFAAVGRSYQRNTAKYIGLPANSRANRLALEKRLAELMADSAVQALNKVELAGGDVGIITSGVSYNYVKEAFGDAYSILKLGLVYPVDIGLVRDFAARVKHLFVVEELDPYLEMQVKAAGIACEGKEYISRFYELDPEAVARSLGRAGLKPLAEPEPATAPVADVPARPPLLCAGCPHRSFFYLARKEKLFVTGDIGCYGLGAVPPLDAMEMSTCMGGGFTNALGLSLNAPQGKKIFGVMGDSTFYHSGLTGAVEAIFNKRMIVPVVLDNRTTAMTGHQENPGSGRTLDGQATFTQQPAAIFKAVGFDRVLKVDAYDLPALRSAIADAGAAVDHVALVIKGPCRLIKGVPKGPLAAVDEEACTKCKACLRLGCPSIAVAAEGFPQIDADSCAGCGVCIQVCEKKAIKHRE